MIIVEIEGDWTKSTLDAARLLAPKKGGTVITDSPAIAAHYAQRGFAIIAISGQGKLDKILPLKSKQQ